MNQTKRTIVRGRLKRNKEVFEDVSSEVGNCSRMSQAKAKQTAWPWPWPWLRPARRPRHAKLSRTGAQVLDALLGLRRRRRRRRLAPAPPLPPPTPPPSRHTLCSLLSPLSPLYVLAPPIPPNLFIPCGYYPRKRATMSSYTRSIENNQKQ